MHMFAECIIAHVGMGTAQYSKVFGYPVVQVQIIDGGHQLAPGKVATGPEDDNDGGGNFIMWFH